MIRRGLSLLLLLAAAGCGCDGEPPRPNVLVIVLDTARADRFSFDGYERPTSPRLDAFAADATVFRDAWSPAGWTGPGHASLFSGLLPVHHGFLEGNRPFLDDPIETMAEILGAAGYETACLTNNWVVSEQWGLTQGFALVEPHYELDTDATAARHTHARALEWIAEREQDDEPFFLFINDIEPHMPYEPEDRYALPFTGEVDRGDLETAKQFNHPSGVGYILGQVNVDAERMGLLSDLYDAEIRALDAELGALLDSLRDAGTLDDTLVVITSDHGEHFGEHDLMDHKFSLHRSLCRVPLVVRFPGRFEGGQVVTDPVRLEDILPTVLELTGLPQRAGLDGKSLTGDLEGRTVRGAWGVWGRFEGELLTFFPGSDLAPIFTSIRSVYDGRWHYMRYSDGREELYDVRADPAEERNLADSEKGAVDRMRGMLEPPPQP